MADYSEYAKEDLILILDQRDQEITDKANRIKDLEDDVTAKDAEILALQEQLVPTPEGVIQGVNTLSKEQGMELAQLIRTTPSGVKAYCSFLYGLQRIPFTDVIPNRGI
jgi:hypothetical protein